MNNNQKKEWFIRQIVEGSSLLDNKSIKEIANSLGILFDKKKYFCLIASCATIENPVTQTSAVLALYEELERVKDWIDRECYFYINKNFSVVILVETDVDERLALVEKIQKDVLRHTPYVIRIGVGRCYDDVEKIDRSYEEATAAMGYTAVDKLVAYIDDIYATRDVTAGKLENEKRRIIDLFKSGRLNEMQARIESIAEMIRKESPIREGMPYPTSIRRTVLEIALEVMHISADAGVDVEKVLGYNNIYAHIWDTNDTPKMLQVFFDISNTLHECIIETSNRVEGNMVTIAKKEIDEHISNPELSLMLVSGLLNITPTYFSALFIRENGIGFNEYIRNLRIEMAKELLATSNKKINTIAGECGFRSSSYFISVFRKQVGMSPGEYRNKNHVSKEPLLQIGQ